MLIFSDKCELVLSSNKIGLLLFAGFFKCSCQNLLFSLDDFKICYQLLSFVNVCLLLL